jgi:uncharacterized protein
MALKIKSFSEEQIIERLRFDNPWWDNSEIPKFYKQWKRRLYFDLFYQLVLQKNIKRAVVLMGPRRVGKTVMLYQTIQQLIDEGIPASKICYISVETPIYNNIGLEQLLRLCMKAQNDISAEGLYVFFDEIQYLKEWEVHLKTLVDSFHDTKFIVSGSAAAALKLKSNESGAGRFRDFTLPPLTFHEYIHLKGEEKLLNKISIEDDNWGSFSFIGSTDYELFNKHFIDYINYGGYPEVVFNPQIQSDPGQYIRNDIIDKVLLRDLPSLYGIRDVQELNALFNVIAYNTGNEFNLEELSKQSGVDKQTIKKYIEYLEAAYLIKVIYPVGINTKRFLRAARFKIYLTNPSMRCALFAPIKYTDEQMMGSMVETAIFSQWMHWGNVPLHYAAWNSGEVDMIMTEPSQKPKWVLEVKWSNLFFDNPGKLKSLIKYASENNKKKVFATSINKTGVKIAGGIIILFFPAASYCYQVGKNSLDNKKETLLLESLE